MTTLKEKILAVYPDGIVRRISENKDLYYQIRKELPYVKYPSVKSYLRSMGFKIAKESEEELKKEIEAGLSENFPDGIVEAKDLAGTSLYYKIKKYNILNETMEEVLSRFGYRYEKGGWDSQYDYITIQKLYNEYFHKQRDLTRLLDINRGTLNNIINGKVNLKASASSWQIDYLEDFEEELLMRCITEKKFMVEENNIRLSIHNNGKGRVALIIRNFEENNIRILFNENIPDYLRRHMDRQGLTYLYEEEMDLFKSSKYIEVLGKKYILADGNNNLLWSSIKGRGIKRRNIEEKMYFRMTGIYGVKGYEFSDENTENILSRNADENGTVAQTNKEILALNRRFRHYRFEMSDPDYQQFEDWEEYVESFGYHMRGVHGISPEAVERAKARIDERNSKMLENHLVCGKRRMVYVPSCSETYRKIYNAYKTRGFSSMAEYVAHLGFQLCSARKENGTVVLAS